MNAPFNQPPSIDPLSVSTSTLLTRFKKFSGVDRAIGFSVLARIWSTACGVLTVILIARFLSAAEQGYYYTFASLVALQIVFELGFSFVILQLAAHERAKLTISPSFEIQGDASAHSRLASVIQKSVRWYFVAGLLMALTLVPVGLLFFASHQSAGIHVQWELPWTLAVVAATLTFQMDPVCSFLEGCGFVSNIARMRLSQSMLGNLLGWIALILHKGLFAPAMVILGQAIMAALFLFSKRGLLIPLLKRKCDVDALQWKTEILPFQWRIAVSWLCGYFIFQIFNPVLFAFQGPAVAGRMGMSLSIVSALGAVTLSWMSTKAAPFGMMIANREFERLDRLFFRTLIQSAVLLVAGAVILIFGVVWVQHVDPRIAQRVLSAPLIALLLATAILNHIVFSQALYLRAHKREPFLLQSILVGILTGTSTIIAGKLWGATGVTIGYFLTSGVFGVLFATAIFTNKRREWHAR